MTIIGAGGMIARLARSRFAMNGKLGRRKMKTSDDSWMARYNTRISAAWRAGDDEDAEWLEKHRQNLLRPTHTLHVERLDQSAAIPTRGSEKSAGLDLYALEEDSVPARGQKGVRTGIALDIPDGHVGMIWPRSGLAANYMIDVMAGVVDSDYTGEIIVILRNHSDLPFKVYEGERVAQIVIQSYNKLEPVEVSDIKRASERGDSGFGSTGRF